MSEFVLKIVKTEACCDALRRAKSAAEGAHQLCAKASRAFGHEAVVIGQCEEVLLSYMD